MLVMNSVRCLRPEFFLIYGGKKSDLGSPGCVCGGGGNKYKSSENEQLTGHFQSSFFLSPERKKQ